MNFSIEKSIEILRRTPGVLDKLLRDISASWILVNEGPGSWNAYDIIGHLIHGELTDWIPRVDIILSQQSEKTFTPFNRFAQFEESQGKTLDQLLDDFSMLREKNIDYILSKKISAADLVKTGIHPVFGEVTLAQLLSTWVVHDLNHIAQVSRVMAKYYAKDVGPWTAYLKILQQ